MNLPDHRWDPIFCAIPSVAEVMMIIDVNFRTDSSDSSVLYVTWWHTLDMRAFQVCINVRRARLPPSMLTTRKYCATHHIARKDAKTTSLELSGSLKYIMTLRIDFMTSELGLWCLCSKLSRMSCFVFLAFRTQHVTCSKIYNTTISCSNRLKLSRSTDRTHKSTSLDFEIIWASSWKSTRWRSAEASFRGSQTTRIFTTTRRALDAQRDTEASIQSHAYKKIQNTTHRSHIYRRVVRPLDAERRDVIRPTAKLHSYLGIFTRVAISASYESCYNRPDGTVNESRNVLSIVNANEMKVGLANCTWR